VIRSYERARRWTIANPDAAAKILSEEAKVSLPVALLQVKLRSDFSNPLPSVEHIRALQVAAPILQQEELVKPGTNLEKSINDLIEPRFARSLIQV
jgi:sulfonate transport system substrate-binding protein